MSQFGPLVHHDQLGDGDRLGFRASQDLRAIDMPPGERPSPDGLAGEFGLGSVLEDDPALGQSPGIFAVEMERVLDLDPSALLP